MNNEKLLQKSREEIGTICGQEKKVILYDLINYTKTKSDSRKLLACLINWDTLEPIDGYTLEELKELSNIINLTIDRMNKLDHPGQMLLFSEK